MRKRLIGAEFAVGSNLTAGMPNTPKRVEYQPDFIGFWMPACEFDSQAVRRKVFIGRGRARRTRMQNETGDTRRYLKNQRLAGMPNTLARAENQPDEIGFWMPACEFDSQARAGRIYRRLSKACSGAGELAA